MLPITTHRFFFAFKTTVNKAKVNFEYTIPFFFYLNLYINHKAIFSPFVVSDRHAKHAWCIESMNTFFLHPSIQHICCYTTNVPLRTNGCVEIVCATDGNNGCKLPNKRYHRTLKQKKGSRHAP